MLENRRPHFTQYFEAVSFSRARRSASSSHSHTIFARAGPFAVIDWLVEGRKRFAPCCRARQKGRGSNKHSHINILIEVGLREIAQVRFCGNYTFTRFSFASVSLICSSSCLLATPAVGRWALLMNGATCLWNSDSTVGFDADSLLQCTLFYSCTIIACAAEMSDSRWFLCGGALTCSKRDVNAAMLVMEEHREEKVFPRTGLD